MKIAYLAVVAHQQYGDLRRLSTWELDSFFDHVGLVIDLQNERMERETEKSRLEADNG